MSLPEIDLVVYPDECDAFGHLNQAAFLSLFERARWEMLLRGPGMDVFTRAGAWPALRKTVIDYRAAAFPGDVLRFSQALTHHGRTSFTMRQTARRLRDDTLIASAEFVFVCIDREGRPIPIPQQFGDYMHAPPHSDEDVARMMIHGVHLAVEVRGEGPAVLFVHGYPMDRTIWQATESLSKPTALATEKMFEVSQELIDKVKTAAHISMDRLQGNTTASGSAVLASAASIVSADQPKIVRGSHKVDIVVIGVSTGGPQGLKQVIPLLPADFPVPVVFVIHMPVGYTQMYAQRLDEISPLNVREAVEGDAVEPGIVLVAQAGKHLTFRRLQNGSVITHLDLRPVDSLHRPSVDVMFQSAAETFKDRVLGRGDDRYGVRWEAGSRMDQIPGRPHFYRERRILRGLWHASQRC